jgi:predicted dehydrogenase
VGGTLKDGVMNIGIVGVGNISAQYFEHFPSLPGLKLIAVADVNEARAAEVAAEQGVEALSVDALLTDPRIDAVLNLTIPAAHVAIATRALEAGKHVYGEKPLALDPDEAAPMLELAAARGLRVGSAPDTVLGTGIQTGRQVLDACTIGEPVSAAVHWSSPGHERWHPAPQFYYQPGGGPLFDMAPYYLTSLVTLLGPVVRVSGAVTRSTRERTVGSGPLAGTAIPVDVDTHVSAILEHAGGQTSTVTVSFEVWASRTPLFELYGTDGTINSRCGRLARRCSSCTARMGRSPFLTRTGSRTLWRCGRRRTRSGERFLCRRDTPTQAVDTAWQTWRTPSRRIGRTVHRVSWLSTCSRSWMRRCAPVTSIA